jgi:hypothetical protein
MSEKSRGLENWLPTTALQMMNFSRADCKAVGRNNGQPTSFVPGTIRLGRDQDVDRVRIVWCIQIPLDVLQTRDALQILDDPFQSSRTPFFAL